MNYFIITGEISGDLHASHLVQQISLLDENAVFKGVGGDYLKSQHVDLIFNLDRMAFMGFYEVVKNLFTIRKNFKLVKGAITSFKPDVVILVDYPGFNLRMARWCKENGFKVVYFISPKFWAWNEGRVEKVKKYVDLMLCILPFEKSFYERHQYANAYYVGHPLADLIENNPVAKHTPENPVIALLPGSRKQEIRSLLPLMLQVAARHPEERFVITGIQKLSALYPDTFPENVSLVFDATYDVLCKAKAAIVCSGTATLETALFNVPQVVVYKTSWLNYQIGKRLAKVQYISLPNLIADDKIVEELIQHNCTVEKIDTQLSGLLQVDAAGFYKSLRIKTGEKGASQRAAQLIAANI